MNFGRRPPTAMETARARKPPRRAASIWLGSLLVLVAVAVFIPQPPVLLVVVGGLLLLPLLANAFLIAFMVESVLARSKQWLAPAAVYGF